ncbi:MAG: LysM peptidoglycan-binding domain-containing protein, partial [Candidatus Omnitrophica bacterium]|nr:LysM peptidoglycan-binding domain-containing protein [Candidatus Omnitrophota bacterium]
MLRKLVAILLCVCLLFEQAVAAAQTVDLSSHITGIMNAELRDKYRPVHLRSLSPLSFSPDDTVRLTFDRGDAAPLTPEHMRENADGSFRHFQVGLALPDEAFWVNLRPDEPERIIDSSLALTDTGRILLEADLLLKKETARLMSPDTPEGREYWQKIITASEKIFGYKGVPLATSTRVWIVPGEIIVRQAPESVYIYKATLNVLLEQDYFRDEYRHESYSPESELNTYAAGVIRDTVIPRLKQEVNVSRHFAPLRQVFYSLILSQWVKRRNRGQTMLYGVNSDSGDLSGLVAAEPWSALECYQEYRRSAMNGEYSFTIGRQSSGGRQVMSAMTGGVDLGFIIPHTLPDIVHPGTHISSPLKDGGRMHILGAQAPVGNNRGYLVSADYRKGKLTVGQFDEDVSLSPLLPAADFSEEDGASTGKKKRRWLRPVKYVLSTLLLTAGSFFLPALALAHKFIMSGSRLIGVPEAWSYASASENTLWGIARNILDAHPELESSAQNIHVLVQEIQRVNPEIVSPHQIYPGQEVDVPEEYATPEVIEALTGVSPAAEQVADTQGDFKESVDSADVLDTPLRPSPGADTPAPEAAEEQAIPLLEQITGGIDVLLTAQPAYFIIAAGVVAAVGIGGLIFFLVRLRQHKKAENETADAREAQPQPNQAWQRISKERRKINGETKQAFEYKLIEQWEQKLEHPEALHAQMPQIRNICRTALAAYPVPKKEGRDFFDKLHRLAYLTIKQLDKELSVTDATLRRAEIGHDLVWLKRAYRVFTHHALAGKSLEQMSVHGGFMIPTVPEVKKNMGRVSYWPRGWLDGVFQKAIWLYRGLRWLAALNRFSGGIATGMWIEKRRIRRHFKASMDLVNGNEQEEGLIPNFYRDRQGTLVHLEEVMQSYANEKWKDGAAYIDRVRKHIMRLVP